MTTSREAISFCMNDRYREKETGNASRVPRLATPQPRQPGNGQLPRQIRGRRAYVVSHTSHRYIVDNITKPDTRSPTRITIPRHPNTLPGDVTETRMPMYTA